VRGRVDVVPVWVKGFGLRLEVRIPLRWTPDPSIGGALRMVPVVPPLLLAHVAMLDRDSDE
jgi:hypothetical protein